MTNRLAGATSPYLRQHAGNPVDWWPWGDDAFAEARRRDVPVLVSVGYSACHWCHVMAHESFEDERTAAHLNEHFVNVKVDREERPDVDAVYMEATQALTGHGGWPMTVFVTPDGQPFFCGTYFPPQPRHGMPSFLQVVAAVVEAWQQRRDEVVATGGRIAAALADQARRLAEATAPPDAQPPRDEDAARALDAVARSYDAARGGFGAAPKFPPSMVLEWLLRRAARVDDVDARDRALAMVAGTCEAMARGGMHDQLAGGFARYSVDADWVVPHFEKMLYDNALLLRVYLHWWRQTGAGLGARVARATADFLLAEMRTPEGGFASALDADSEGVEGRFYVWTPDELADALGADDAASAAELFGVTASGTFEHGASVLQLRRDPEDRERFDGIRRALLDARARRVRPGRDDKVVTAWNGLAVAALAEAGALLDEPRYVDAAASAADLLLRVHRDPAARLLRTSRDGRPGPHPAVLEDHGCLADGLLALHAVTGDARWYREAGKLLDAVLDRYADEEGRLWDVAAADLDRRLATVRRPHDVTDGATPSGTAATAGALLTFAALSGSERHRAAAERALVPYRALAAQPRAAGWGLAVAEARLDGPREVAVVGPAGDAATRALLRAALAAPAPGAAVTVGGAGLGDQAPVPLLAHRPLVDGRPAVYVCRHFVCAAPVTTAEAVAVALAGPLSANAR